MRPSDRPVEYQCSSLNTQECDYSVMSYFITDDGTKVWPMCKKHKRLATRQSWLKRITAEEAYVYLIQSE